MTRAKAPRRTEPNKTVAEKPTVRDQLASPIQKCMTVVLCLLSLLFLISLFKNISYPLLWADESMTVMGGSRVLKYGYPKVHDGKNVLYDLQHPDKTLGIDKKTDAYVAGASWGMYYVAALGIKVAEISDDIYVRTGLLRFLFALSGLGGLILWAAIGVQLFHDSSTKKAFLICFAFLTLISVSLVLHLREVRYYSLMVLLTSVATYTYGRYRILGQMSLRRYSILLPVSLLLLYVVFSPAYVIFLVTITGCECAFLSVAIFRLRTGGQTKKRQDKIKKSSRNTTELLRTHLLQSLPLLLSLIVVFPLMLFFDTFRVSRELSQFYASVFHTDALGMYLNNLSIAWKFFTSLELLYLAVF